MVTGRRNRRPGYIISQDFLLVCVYVCVCVCVCVCVLCVCVCTRPCLHKVDVVGLQPLQTLLNAVRDVSATEAHSVGVAGVHLEPDFGAHDEPIPFLSVMERGQ